MARRNGCRRINKFAAKLKKGGYLDKRKDRTRNLRNNGSNNRHHYLIIRVFGHYGHSEVVVDHAECSISMSTDMRDITTKTAADSARFCRPEVASLSLSVCLLKITNGFNQSSTTVAGDLLYVIFTNVGSGSAANQATNSLTFPATSQPGATAGADNVFF